MHHITRRHVAFVAFILSLLIPAAPLNARILVSIDEVAWENRGVPPNQTVLFTIPFVNPDAEATPPTDGTLNAQEFGAFLPDSDLICEFTIPSIPPNGRVEVVCEIGLDELPGNAPRLDLAGNWLSLPETPAPPGVPSIAVVGCPILDYWGGGVDIIWQGTEPGRAIVHRGILPVCQGFASSYIQITTDCTESGGISWSFANVCPDWTATVVNSVFAPAPNPLPAGQWTGWIELTSTLPLGATCDIDLDMACGSGIARIHVMGQVCQCDRPLPLEPSTWGQIKSMYPD